MTTFNKQTNKIDKISIKEKIKIRVPEREDIEEIGELFNDVIRDNFSILGIEESMKEDLEGEIKSQIDNLLSYFNNPISKEYYLIATIDNRIVGVIAYGKVGPIIEEHLDIDIDIIPEIKSVYITKDYQRSGIGSRLYSEIIKEVKKKEYKGYLLDCGYSHSQPFWRKKVGEPVKILKDYWGEGVDHMIWLKRF